MAEVRAMGTASEVKVYKPGDPGFEAVAAECLHISDIKQPQKREVLPD